MRPDRPKHVHIADIPTRCPLFGAEPEKGLVPAPDAGPAAIAANSARIRVSRWPGWQADRHGQGRGTLTPGRGRQETKDEPQLRSRRYRARPASANRETNVLQPRLSTARPLHLRSLHDPRLSRKVPQPNPVPGRQAHPQLLLLLIPQPSNENGEGANAKANVRNCRR